MNTVALSPRLSTTNDSFKLGDGRSVRWFVEALQLFRRFDETASKDALRDARKLLRQCVEANPQDVLPDFYLAIAESVLGDMNQDKAISTFERYSRSEQFEIRVAAEYNLAAAYVETYRAENLSKAATLLDQLIADLKVRGAPIGISPWIKSIHDRFSSRQTRVEQLYYQALETQAYVRAELDIWRPRWQLPAPADFEKTAQSALSDIKGREDAMKAHQRFLGEQGPEIWAWHWNTIGYIEEARAAHAQRSGDTANAATFADQAEGAYKQALEADPRFDSARANLGRLHLEITQKLSESAQILSEALKGAEDSDYTYYNLGLVRTLQGDQGAAVEAFSKCSAMLDDHEQPVSWVGARKILAKQLVKWGREVEAVQLLRTLAQERPNDDDVRRHIAELEASLATP